MEEVDSETDRNYEVDLSRDDQTKPGKTEWHCEKCGKKYVQLKSFRSHNCDKRGVDKIPCPSCSKLISRCNITHHLKTHLLGKKLKCNKCTLTFENEELKKVHNMKQHYKHMCNDCGKTFKRPFPLKEHMKTHEHENESNKEGVDKNAVQENAFKEVGKGFKCKVCESILSSITSLKFHMNKEHVKDGIKCSECENIFFSKRGLKDHMKNHKMKEKVSKNDNNLEVDFTNEVGDVQFFTIPDGEPFPEGAVVIDIGNDVDDNLIYF